MNDCYSDFPGGKSVKIFATALSINIFNYCFEFKKLIAMKRDFEIVRGQHPVAHLFCQPYVLME